MKYKVRYRCGNGGMSYVTVDAADRTRCVAECRRRGITPMDIQVVANGGRDGRPGPLLSWRGAAIAALIISVVGTFMWMLTVNWDAKPRGAIGTAGRIIPDSGGKTVKTDGPRKTTTRVVASAPAVPSSRPTMADVTVSSGSATPAHKAEETDRPLPVSVFGSGVEQVLSMVFNCEIGTLPPPLPVISDAESRKIWDILKSRIEVMEKDDDKTAAAKEMIDFAKKEMSAFMEQGGDPDKFLKFYHGELRRAHELREMFRRELEKAIDEKPDEAADMYRAMNEALAKDGIRGLDLDDEDRERIGLGGEDVTDVRPNDIDSSHKQKDKGT